LKKEKETEKKERKTEAKHFLHNLGEAYITGFRDGHAEGVEFGYNVRKKMQKSKLEYA
jgi:flagellar biosynthesis/type III secretory pathway protein FliH